MTNKPKKIGTQFTADTIRFLIPNGFPHAELRNQAGQYDKGDITGIPAVVIECKGGKAAENASDGQVAAWMVETERERINAKADIGVLVMKRKAIGAANAGQWWAVVHSSHLNPWVHDAPIRMHLTDCVRWLREMGHGSPLTDEERAAA